MDASPSKRRRTSPSSSVAVTVENTDLGLLPQHGAGTGRRRSSFMSPTKASFARFHPSLLPRAKSAEPPRSVSKKVHGSSEPGSVVADGMNGTARLVAATPSKELESGINGGEKEQGLRATPRRSSKTPGEGNASSNKGQFVIDPGPRASRLEEARDAGTAVNDTNGGQQEPIAEEADIGSSGITFVPDSQNHQLTSTPTQSGPYFPLSGMGIGEDGEPSLPSTPSQLGLEPPRERPKGLLFSSPSRRSRRKRRSSVRSSPLKPPDVPPDYQNQNRESLVASLGPRRYIANTPKPPPPPEEARLLEMRSKLGDLEKQLQDIEDKILRQLLVSPWQQDGRKEAKGISKQNKEIVQRGAKVVQLRDEILQIQAAQSIDHGQARPEAIDWKIATVKPSTISQRLAEFLPFSMKHRPPEPRSPSPKNMGANQVLDLDMPESTAAPFTITTSDTLLLPSALDNSLLQRQDVHMSTPQQTLTCDLQLTANIATQRISHLDIQAISPWAESELGSWLRQSREEMELATLGRAFGRYWEDARLRGKCWVSCKQNFTNLVANAPDSNSPLLYLGLQDLIFARSNVQLKVTWHISLSDRGEVESHSSAYPRFPAAWQQEANSELTKVGDAFTMLLEDKGVSEAIRIICKVVFPT